MDLDTPDPFFNILCLPDLVRPAATDPNALHHTNAMTVYSEAALVCKNKHAFLLIDPLPDVTTVGAAEAWKTLKFTFQSNHSAAFFPSIRVDDPLVPGSIRSHPPSGAIAGVIARTDGQSGVWTAPAGTEASLTGVYGPSTPLSDEEHGILNPLGLNCIRQFPIFGTVNFGSRTVDGSNALASEWKYIPVRRTASYILRSLSEGLRWAVHKPNGERLWAELRMNVTAFMHGLFRQGAFKGVSSREAYFVLCDSSTTTADDINQGIVNIVIGFAPLRPAEFVVISLRQIVQPAV
jgi:phage tail sheath protein FI